MRESVDNSRFTIDELDAEEMIPLAPATPEGTDLVLRNLITGEEKLSACK
jgi:hypothetical protein